jgi:hypothetical protein
MDEKRSDPSNDPAHEHERDRKAAKAERKPDSGQSGDDGTQTDDERVDEASRDSFPASDPPAQP